SVVVCIIDSTKIERGLYLALEIIERGSRVVVALNMWDIAEDKNINIDVEKLRQILVVPVVPTIAVSGEGIKELVSRISGATSVKIESVMKNVGDS
ncbi:MAG: FeoB small GTPase domain-containing protein, partial [Candidatus Thermoplasmatota archaeon]|nr:FeoB small GTPase domain-containing protein [Candidatus Thermoplasmatota archaeon]